MAKAHELCHLLLSCSGISCDLLMKPHNFDKQFPPSHLSISTRSQTLSYNSSKNDQKSRRAKSRKIESVIKEKTLCHSSGFMYCVLSIMSFSSNRCLSSVASTRSGGNGAAWRFGSGVTAAGAATGASSGDGSGAAGGSAAGGAVAAWRWRWNSRIRAASDESGWKGYMSGWSK